MKTVIEMAREANLPACHTTHPKALKRFAELVRAEEREACARLVDYWEARQGEHADAIRARGETK